MCRPKLQCKNVKAEGRLPSVHQKGGGHLLDSVGEGSIIAGGRILVAYSSDMNYKGRINQLW